MSIPHATGIVIGCNAEIGENVKVYQNVTIGGKGVHYEANFPTIGDDVVVYSGSAVLGDISIGDNSVIAANSVVLDDVPKGVVVAGAPAEVVKENDSIE